MLWDLTFHENIGMNDGYFDLECCCDLFDYTLITMKHISYSYHFQINSQHFPGKIENV